MSQEEVKSMAKLKICVTRVTKTFNVDPPFKEAEYHPRKPFACGKGMEATEMSEIVQQSRCQK